MLLLSLLCIVLAVVVLRAKRPAEVPNSSRLYRLDNRVVAAVLITLAVSFIILGYATHTLY